MKKKHSAEEVLTQLFKTLGISIKEVVRVELVGQVFYDVQTSDSDLFLDKNQEGVRALDTLVPQLVGEDYEDERFSIDINSVRRKKIEALQEQARLLARRAESLSCEVEMPPMSSYDRLIVHETLKENTNVSTESRGEGHLRHVVITTTPS